jgi:ketopantoate hydroxymethyltransferase
MGGIAYWIGVFVSENIHQASEILEDAISLEKAGACGIMLTAVSVEAARQITEYLNVPTIGIGYVYVPQGLSTAHRVE